MKRNIYLGLFFVTLATLTYEILLTRIFSVTMWYHFAFVAISVAMFGMTLGAIVVYLRPNYFTIEKTSYHLALSSLLFAISIVFSFFTHLCIPFIVEKSIIGLYSIALNYVVISVPFVFSGICVCLALTRFPNHVSRLYAADLAGAAIGCVLIIYLLKITDGPTAVLFVALIAGLGVVAFAAGEKAGYLWRTSLVTCILLAFFASAHTILVRRQASLMRLVWVKEELEERPLYEKWNSFSRIKVGGDPNNDVQPSGGGISSTYSFDQTIRKMQLSIDANAATDLTAFDGNLNKQEYLKYDIINMVHYLRPNSKVLVIGTGGGRDVLSALAFGQRSVTGVEINKDIIDVVNERFGDFTGHLDKYPQVTFINDEGRSYISRHNDQFDIIQVSFIDTWAATAAGAFVLTENSLYTVEAWNTFLERLSPHGVLTFSRWYFRDRPGEVYRLTSLATASLIQLGIKEPRNHILIVRKMEPEGSVYSADGVGTILVSKEPFSEHDLNVVKDICNRMQFDLVLTPSFSLDPTFARISSGTELDSFARSFPINIEAPTDDSPFFFHMLRLRDMFNLELIKSGHESFNMKAVAVLGGLILIVLVLTSLCIIVPLALTTKKASLSGGVPFFLFFGFIGLGFMFVEISQMQRLIVFLGHPVYGLSVVLFALLLSGGLGSYLTQKVAGANFNRSSIGLILLLCALVIFGLITPQAISSFRGSTTSVRILVSVAIISFLGVFMGMAFPLGMRAASSRFTSLTPWFWGINGATSVCASVLAVAMALTSSISMSYWTGVVCYLIAFISFVWATRLERVKVGSDSPINSRPVDAELVLSD